MIEVVILLLTISMWFYFGVLLISMPLVAISALIGYFIGGAWGAIIGFILGAGFFAPRD